MGSALYPYVNFFTIIMISNFYTRSPIVGDFLQRSSLLGLSNPEQWSLGGGERFWKENIIFFHDIYLTRITGGIMFSTLIALFFLFGAKRRNFLLRKKRLLEFAWTTLPGGILLLICFPSIGILYGMEDRTGQEFNFSFKTVGSQWFWTYFGVNEVESYMEGGDENGISLIRASNYLEVPSNCKIRNFIRSSDVMHRWSLPTLTIKVDAIPGRLNRIPLLFEERNRMYFGQCSELCGVNHRFMPIVVKTL